jgi:hypothetical protein
MAIEFDIETSPKKKADSSVVKYYTWLPKEDITTYELAQILPILLYGQKCPMSMGHFVQDLPANLKRHFEEAE